jgi:4-hydroxy-2-oxoglutarate aldolase
MTDNALIRHFTEVADAADIPILIYNVPKFTHLNISAEAVRELSRHPNIIGMKDSRGDIPQLEAFQNAAPREFNLIVGSAPILYPALALGVKAGILALANCAPVQCTEIQKLYDKGEREKAKDLQARMLPVNKAISDTYGIAGLKYASALMGYEGGSVRSPLLPLDREGETDIRRIMERAGILPR